MPPNGLAAGSRRLKRSRLRRTAPLRGAQGKASVKPQRLHWRRSAPAVRALRQMLGKLHHQDRADRMAGVGQSVAGADRLRVPARQRTGPYGLAPLTLGTRRTHARTCVLLIRDLHIRVINAATGELLRELVLDPR